MKDTSSLHKEAMDMLLHTSRTFFIPISLLPSKLKETVAAAYLCMRAIDEIEDHPELPSDVKIHLLHTISLVIEESNLNNKLNVLFEPYKSVLPEVTLRLADWASLCPVSMLPNVKMATARMSKGMAQWVSKQWKIKSEEDLNDYTFYVAGLVGLLLADIWQWHEEVDTDRELAVAFGRGLQAVNIIRNRTEDLSRGVNFWPDGWELDDMFEYAKRNLALADTYLKGIKRGPIFTFCQIPLVLANATLDAIKAGHQKLSRTAVADLLKGITTSPTQ
ncbi:phytoene/squalene synthase family protein [Aneurinibacillus sp. Ricciae_BoGa-3]|uniref:phytoene/squalene synthase family protein n=1 Tax=Aneurinibacillus sp. Ricciae_BoGa-3 TaxID=3022697 RepID=UPI0023418AD9|nr:phytoene/squalene synthase family protein [Aneurinibacillus sp. Ricciae_BoGa-3]WCK54100.1 phytoene/squalene synthase family protein [Aneurinibacillus sp. Ricciae_BoGa-3]